MPKIRREIQLGILFALTILLFVWGLNYLKGKNIFQRQITFYAVYDNVSGLLESNPVSINGLKVGQIDRIAFHPDGSGKVVVTSIIGRQIPIPANSVAYLGSPDLVGGKQIMIELGTGPAIIGQGDTLQGVIKQSIADDIATQFMPVMEKAGNMIVKMDSVLTAAHQILGSENRELLNNSFRQLDASLTSLSNTTAQTENLLRDESGRLSEIFSSTLSVIKNIESQNEALAGIVVNMSEITDSLAVSELKATINQAGRSLQEFAALMEQINAGEGSAGLLLKDESLFRNLEAASAQLEMLLEDIRENPGKYFRISVFGR